MSILFLVLGLACILFGANLLTDGASALAKRYGISDLVIGLTIVAFGTSAPELAISILSALDGNAGLAIGNVVGSNIFNILTIIGVVALIKPIRVEPSIMTNEIPLVILSSLAVLICGNTVLLDGSAENVITRSMGLLLILFFLIFMRYTFSIAKDSDPAASDAPDAPIKPMPLWKSALFILIGLAGLVGGGELFVNGASDIARALNVSEAVIGLTIVAMSTSFPELATSAVAARKGKPGIAIGNVIGSCIFNVFAVLGISSAITPLPFGTIGNLDLLTLTGASILFWIFGWFFSKRTITRPEGVVMLLCYGAYMTAVVLGAV